MRILTFNSHQGYVFFLCKLPHRFFIVQPRHGLWDWRVRPLPPNAELVSLEAGRNLSATHGVDLAICHNTFDLLDLRDLDLPKILVIHLSLSGRIANEKVTVSHSEYIAALKALIEKMDVAVVHTTAKRAEEWKVPGELIDLAVDPDDYYGYHGRRPAVLRVGNRLKERDASFGYRIQEKILGLLPSTILGRNPLLPHAYVPDSWEALKEAYREHRVYLSTLHPVYEDGYNLSVLEAMATGMPIVTTPNNSSPIVDGVNGFVSEDIERLRAHIQELLSDLDLAQRLGRQARETACDRFHIRKFLQDWTTRIEIVAQRR